MTETRIETANRIANDELLLSEHRSVLAEAIEAALKERDERAARIAESHEWTHGNMHFGYCGPAIAAAIRRVNEK